jgi:hypothetical protein
MIPLEIDLERVHRTREVGLRGLGQQLKSFRDRTVEFSVYSAAARNWPYLNSLGKLEKPTRSLRDPGDQPKEVSSEP